MNTKAKFSIAGVSGILFVILIVLLKTVDVAPIGPEGTSIGLSQINKAVNESLGVSDLWYKITKVMEIVADLTVLIFGLIGVTQLVKRKSLLKVDKDILALGGLYVVTAAMYALFEVMIINYRPIIMEGDEHVEASFPSSHTMLICVIMGSAIMLMSKYIKNEKLRVILSILCVAVMVVMAAGRLLAGVHWLTDITGGVLISITLLAAFAGVRDIIGKE